MMKVMCRLNLPSIFIYGGSILPGSFRGKPVTVQDLFEAVGRHSVGSMSDADLDELGRVACPAAGAFRAPFTPHTLAPPAVADGPPLPDFSHPPPPPPDPGP